MWSKIYLGVLGVSVAVMAFFTYYACSWLQSIGQPAAAIDGYLYHAGLGWGFLWITTLILLLIANGVLWATERAWAMWATFAFAAVFLIAKFFWLEPAFLGFARENGMTDRSFSLGPLWGAILVIVVGVVIFANQFASVRLRRKMYAAPLDEAPAPADDAPEPRAE